MIIPQTEKNDPISEKALVQRFIVWKLFSGKRERSEYSKYH